MTLFLFRHSKLNNTNYCETASNGTNKLASFTMLSWWEHSCSLMSWDLECSVWTHSFPCVSSLLPGRITLMYFFWVIFISLFSCSLAWFCLNVISSPSVILRKVSCHVMRTQSEVEDTEQEVVIPGQQVSRNRDQPITSGEKLWRWSLSPSRKYISVVCW